VISPWVAQPSRETPATTRRERWRREPRRR
jgi:hypothetical protein